MGKSIRWRRGVAEYGYKCAACGKVVFDAEKKQLVGCYEKQDIFKTGTMICCGRCGQSVGVIVEREGGN